MPEVTGLRLQLVTTRALCFATDPMNLANKDVLRTLASLHSTLVLTLRFLLAGTQPSNSSQEPKRKNVSFIFKFDLVGDPNSILVRHRQFLAELEHKKIEEREIQMLDEHNKDVKARHFKD
jgi:hypothetical protein